MTDVFHSAPLKLWEEAAKGMVFTSKRIDFLS